MVVFVQGPQQVRQLRHPVEVEAFRRHCRDKRRRGCARDSSTTCPPRPRPSPIKIQGLGAFTYSRFLWYFFGINVGKWYVHDSIPIDPMGLGIAWFEVPQISSWVMILSICGKEMRLIASGYIDSTKSHGIDFFWCFSHHVHRIFGRHCHSRSRPSVVISPSVASSLEYLRM